jgi:hypothetical protein
LVCQSVFGTPSSSVMTSSSSTPLPSIPHAAAHDMPSLPMLGGASAVLAVAARASISKGDAVPFFPVNVKRDDFLGKQKRHEVAWGGVPRCCRRNCCYICISCSTSAIC